MISTSLLEQSVLKTERVKVLGWFKVSESAATLPHSTGKENHAIMTQYQPLLSEYIYIFMNSLIRDQPYACEKEEMLIITSRLIER